MAEDAAKLIHESTFDWKSASEQEMKTEVGSCINRAVQAVAGIQIGPSVLLIALPHTGKLWRFDVGENPMVRPVKDHTVEGDHKTTVAHLIDHYQPTNLTMECCIILASHAVCMGNKESRSSIAGLEVVLIPKEGVPYSLTEAQENELQALSSAIDIGIAALLDQPFRPVTPSTT